MELAHSARTHASSAHGEGRKVYNLKPRHARLAINSAHTVALFVLETWDERRKK
ncbi:abortive infection family protein [Paraglaciecola sp.]|uniref:abortive infection family protein n=1 Tax=Paraglaciecola sp. TaxID=1920173 RepID=UPI003264B9E5